jgi:hypothetical protein
VKGGHNYFEREAAANFIFLLEASDSKNAATAHISLTTVFENSYVSRKNRLLSEDIHFGAEF